MADTNENKAPVPGRNPSVGRAVHYASLGKCLAATITEVTPLEGDDAAQADVENWDQDQRCRVGLAVLNPPGFLPALFQESGVWQDAAHKRSGTWHWPERV